MIQEGSRCDEFFMGVVSLRFEGPAHPLYQDQSTLKVNSILPAESNKLTSGTVASRRDTSLSL
jgi:hypothetical protein